MIADNNIYPISAIQADILVNHRKRYLPKVSNSILGKFETQAFLVSGFEKARSQFAMNIDREPNDTPADCAAARQAHPTFSVSSVNSVVKINAVELLVGE